MAGRVILGWSYSVEVDSRDRRINVLGSTQDVVMVSKRKTGWLMVMKDLFVISKKTK